MQSAPVLAFLAGIALLLSGCAGTTATNSDVPAQPSSDVVAAGDALPDAATLQGLVLDDAQLPIPNAIVGVLELSLQAATDAAGAFRFTNLPPGAYTLSAAALGYTSTSKRVTLEANGELTQVLMLVAIPIDVAYHETNGPFDGFFSCKLGIPVQSTACGSILVGVAFRTDDIVWSGDRAFQWWNLTSPNWDTIIGELEWTQGTFATTTKLRSSFDHERFGSHWFCGQEGHGPLYYRYQRDNETGATCQGNSASANSEPFVPEFGKPIVTGFRVPFGCNPANPSAACEGDPLDNPPVYLAFQQRVTSYMSVFYGEPAPDLWHAQADS
jgi:hypothetical protein